MSRLDEAFEALEQGYMYDETGKKWSIQAISKIWIDAVRVSNGKIVYNRFFISEKNWDLEPRIKLPEALNLLKEICNDGDKIMYNNNEVTYTDGVTEIKMKNLFIPGLENGIYTIINVGNDKIYMSR